MHGAIDGFSRLIPYLFVNPNNRTRTALQFFLSGVSAFGLPSRVRTDDGGENIYIGRFMEQSRGADRGSHLTGRSVHNQRIERLWRDVYSCVLDKLYTFFYYLEDSGLLCITNTVHLFVLHFVFLPRIQRSLVTWTNSWNHHRLSTEHNQTPLQLWIGGILSGGPSTGIQSVLQNHAVQLTGSLLHDYGVAWNLADPTDVNIVVVPDVYVPLNAEELHQLQTDFNVLEDISSNGLNIYVAVLQRVISILTQHQEETGSN